MISETVTRVFGECETHEDVARRLLTVNEVFVNTITALYETTAEMAGVWPADFDRSIVAGLQVNAEARKALLRLESE